MLLGVSVGATVQRNYSLAAAVRILVVNIKEELKVRGSRLESHKLLLVRPASCTPRS